jgi:hypothetical protein
MVRVRDEESKRPEDFGSHSAFDQAGQSFHKGWEYIMSKSLGLESIQEPLYDSYTKLVKDCNLLNINLLIRNSLLALN